VGLIAEEGSGRIGPTGSDARWIHWSFRALVRPLLLFVVEMNVFL
jgi:hypothetical protein